MVFIPISASVRVVNPRTDLHHCGRRRLLVYDRAAFGGRVLHDIVFGRCLRDRRDRESRRQRGSNSKASHRTLLRLSVALEDKVGITNPFHKKGFVKNVNGLTN